MDLWKYCCNLTEILTDEIRHQSDEIVQETSPKRFIMSEYDNYKVSLVNNHIDKIYLNQKEITEAPEIISWFVIVNEEYIPRAELYEKLSEISKNRKTYHSSEWFYNKLSSIRFKFRNGKFIPYRYTTISKD